MTPWKRTSDLLDLVLDGEELTPADIDHLRAKDRREDLHLDFKGTGDDPTRRKEFLARGAKSVIVEYVAAFANSAGGLLVFGIENSSRDFSGWPAEKGVAWASDCLVGLAPYLSPPPRFAWVDHPDGGVLVVAVARAPRLVPVVREGRMKYFLRIDDKTVEAPDYLISDLVLGARQRPDLKLEVEVDVRTLGDPSFGVRIFASNDGLTLAEDVSCGMAGWCWDEFKRRPGVFVDDGRMRMHLRQHVKVAGVPDEADIALYTGNAPIVSALSRVHLRGINVQLGPRPGAWRWRGALFISARAMFPAWYQLTVSREPNVSSHHHELVTEGRPEISVERIG